jgi:hypothetical protein
MRAPIPDDDDLDLEADRSIRKVKRLMTVSLTLTLLAVAGVLGIVGYRVFSRDPGVTPADVSIALPKGAKVLSTSVAGDRLLVTLDIGGIIEVRSFDVKSWRPLGRLRFAVEP